MMRHPETSKLIKEALASPLGSTKRAKAQKTLSIMNKLQYAHDGAGGPGMMMERYMTPEQEPVPQTNNPKGIVIFHKIPKPKINYYSGSKAVKPKPQPGAQDGSGGPGAYFDGQGGFFSDLGDMFSDFAKPFTDLIGTTSTAPKTTTSSFIGPVQPNMSYAPTNMSVAPKTTTTTPNMSVAPAPAPAPSTYQPGLIQQGLSWLGKTALPTVGKTILSLGAAIPATAQYVTQNALQGATDLSRSLFGYDASKPNPGPGYTSIYDTWAAEGIRNLWPNVTAGTSQSTPRPTDTSTTTTPASYPTLNQPQQTGGGTLPNGWNIFSGSGSSSSYSGGSSNPFTTTPSTVTPPSSGASAGYSGGASEGYSGGWSGGYGGEIVQSIMSKPLAMLTPEEKTELYNAQIKREGSTLPNNPFGIKQGGATQKWVDQGLAVVGGEAKDGGKFLIFKDAPTAQAAYEDLLYNSGVYSGLTVDEAMHKWSGSVKTGAGSGAPIGSSSGGGSTPSSFSSIEAAAKAAVAAGNSSPTTFALQQMTDPNNPVTGGKLFSEAQAENKRNIWDAYKLDTTKTAIEKLQAEVTALPKDMTDYISARDSYIKQTDKAIDDYMESMKNMDMSNPLVVQQTTSHLNYLYTLRGRQNQSYMGYLNDAVSQHETKLNNAITDYNSKLAVAEAELTSANEITRDKYNTYAASLTELFQAVQDAPVKALQLQALQNQVYNAAGTGATDQVAYDAKMGYIPQSGKLADAHFVDNNGFARLGTNLVDELNMYAQSDPSILPANIIRAYVQGVQSYLNAADEKDGVTGTGVTSAGKKQMAEEAIRNFAQLAAVGMQSGNDAAVSQGVQSAMQIGQSLSSQLANNIRGTAPQVMEAVKTLAPGGHWYTLGLTRAAPPSLSTFVETMKAKTNNNPLADSIAKAIYATFLRYSQEQGSTPSGAVEALLNNVTSTTGRVPYTPDEFANVIGRLYAEDVLMSEFSISQGAAMAMQNQLYSAQ